jgi:hypothetical protein
VNGRLGWVPHGTHEGHEIYVAHGSLLPPILRKITGDGDSVNTMDANASFKLVGTAHI